MEDVTIGIVGAGHRGRYHAERYAEVPGATVTAVADVNEDAARSLAADFDVSGVYDDALAMIEGESVDVVSVAVHNNLHEPVATAAFEAGAHVFCEKPLAATYADATRIVEAADAADRLLGVQNDDIFTPETAAAKNLVAAGELGDVNYAQTIQSSRRSRPYVDGYGTPAFVREESAGGGPVLDHATYGVGRLFYLLEEPRVERVAGSTVSTTDDQYDEALVGDAAAGYRERLAESGYDVEDAGEGRAVLADGTTVHVRSAWHHYGPEERDAITGSRGGVAFDPVEFYTTTADLETTATVDVGEFAWRRGIVEGEDDYEPAERTQFHHFVDVVRGAVEPIPTGAIHHEAMLVLEGIYLAAEAGRELTREEIAERSESVALDL